MPIINRIADYHDEMKEWRQHIHRNPELNFDCHKTAAFVVKKLKEFGLKATTIARGIPIGGELEYADEITLGRSIMTRTTYDQ